MLLLINFFILKGKQLEATEPNIFLFIDDTDLLSNLC